MADWSWYFVFGAISGPLCSAIGAAMLFLRPARFQTRILGIVIFLEGVMMAAGGGWAHIIEEARWSYAVQAMTNFVAPAAMFGYLVFLGTLDGSVARFLARGRWLFIVGMVAGPLSWLVYPAFLDSPAGFTGMALMWLVFAFLGLATVITQWRTMDGPARARGRRMTVAFLWRDVVLVTTVVLFTLSGGSQRGAAADASRLNAMAGTFLPAVMLLGFVVLLCYAVLRDQIFGIELQLKRAVKGSAIAAPIGLAFVVASELTEQLLPVGGLWFGVAAAVAVSLAFKPIERVATRLADRALPGVADTGEYRRRRADEIYAAALQAASRDGAVDAKEQEALRRLAADLGVA